MRDGLTSWEFGDLPERIEIKRGDATFSGFPAVIDQKDTVGVRVLDNRETSIQCNRAGVRRLFMLQLEHQLNQLVRSLEHVDEMKLLYKPMGAWADLKEDLLLAAVDRSLFTPAEDIRSRDVFVRKARDGWQNLSASVRELNGLAYEILQIVAQLHLELNRTAPPLLETPIAEMRDQLKKLVPKTFLSSTPTEWLRHLPRYLKAIQVRHSKLLNAGYRRDQDAAATVQAISSAYTQRRTSHAAKGIFDPELGKLWWMIQELRVSLFAQELKTPFPISLQRVEKQLNLVQP